MLVILPFLLFLIATQVEFDDAQRHTPDTTPRRSATGKIYDAEKTVAHEYLFRGNVNVDHGRAYARNPSDSIQVRRCLTFDSKFFELKSLFRLG